MTQGRPGPDHTLYTHSPFPSRPRLEWPNDAHVALCVFLYVEHWELKPREDAVYDHRMDGALGGIFPNYKVHSQFEYGNRVGIFRVLQALERHGLPVTVAANASACERYPFLIDHLRSRRYAFVAHGTAANRMISSRMSEAEEREEIAATVNAITSATGAPPRGWLGQDFGASTRTPQLLADAGLSYLAEWANDDQPYWMLTQPELLSIPNQAEWDDVQLIWHRKLHPSVWRDCACSAFDRLHEDGGKTGMFFGLHLHPWLVGMPHRIGYLEAVLEHITALPGVWRATADQVDGHMRSHPP